MQKKMLNVFFLILLKFKNLLCSFLNLDKIKIYNFQIKSGSHELK